MAYLKLVTDGTTSLDPNTNHDPNDEPQTMRPSQAKTSYCPGGGETICPRRPMAVRLAADLRPSADGSAVRTWLSCRQPACL